MKELKAIKEGFKSTTKNTIIYSDSQAAISAVSNGTTKDRKAQKVIDEIWLESRDQEKTLAVRWIKSEDNPADDPSRNIRRDEILPREIKVNPRELIRFQWEKCKYTNRYNHKDEASYLHTKYSRKKSHIELMNLPFDVAADILSKIDRKPRNRIMDKIDRVDWANNRFVQFVRSNMD